MLVSRQHRIAFAHYPKTAGKSLQHWFIDTFPDAKLLIEENPHLSVGQSYQLLRPNRWKKRWNRLCTRSLGLVSPAIAEQCLAPESLRVVGAVRDPFEMIVSLFEFWKREPFEIEPTDPFIRCARRGTFRDFVAAAVVGSRVFKYEDFFGVGGPLWRNTTLLDFETIQSALAHYCTAMGIPNHRPLPELNRAPAGHRDLDRYRAEAGPLVGEVRRYFRWYYEEGIHLMIRGDQPASLRSAA